ncbi:MAG: SEC-C domain-containing protein [Clostridiales Family XIII bacterium]|nr:SEC-C domain-containing protein [Clostridiales Family XIII bacterium]
MKEEQAQLLYHLLLGLARYTNDRFQVVEDLFDYETLSMDTEKMSVLLDYIWERGDRIIDDFIAENPWGFSLDELEIVGSWKHRVYSHFFVVAHRDRGSVLLLDDRAFLVSGISNDIDEILPDLPSGVETALLPFEGRIVYDTIFRSLPVVLGPSIRKMVKEQYENHLVADDIISDAKGLTRASKAILDEKRKAAREEANRKKSPPVDDEPHEQVHRSIYADMTNDEIEAEMVSSISGIVEEIKHLKQETLDVLSIPRAPADDLETGFGYLKKDTLAAIASAALIKNAASMRKADLIKKMASYFSDPKIIEDLFRDLKASQFAAFKRIFEAGGRLSLPRESVEEVLPAAGAEPLVFVYRQEGAQDREEAVFTFVIPWQIQEISEEFKENGFFEYLDTMHGIDQCAAAAAELYGVLTLDEFADLCLEYFPLDPPLTREEVEDILFGFMQPEDSDYEIMNLDGTECLLWYELTEEPEDGGKIDEDEGEDEELKPLEFAAYIKKRHESRQMKHLSKEELLSYSMLEYSTSMPEYERLRRFLNENIPDSWDKDDLFFAENVLEGLCDFAQWDAPMQSVVDWLIEMGLVLELDKMNILLGLVSDVLNHLPRWTNFGWAPHEAFGRQRAVGPCADDDADEDEPREPYRREAAKIGRNDPCPCGSGKKYKNCCGKPLN